jgi:hypothetical protein
VLRARESTVGATAGVGGIALKNPCERPHSHVAYGNALFAARGIGAPETTEAFARAREAALAPD